MAFSSITTPIAEAWIDAYNTKASGAVKAGQAVIPGPADNVCVACTAKLENSSDKGLLGVAAYDAAHGNPVSVYTTGTVVQGRASGSVHVGANLSVSKGGYFYSGSGPIASGTSHGVALEAATNGNAFSLVLK